MAPFKPVQLLGGYAGILAGYSYIAVSPAWNGEGITYTNASNLYMNKISYAVNVLPVELL